MSTVWPFDKEEENRVLVVEARGFPAPRHAAEPDMFCRQAQMPDHRQDLLEAAHIMVAGCGGLGSWTALALGRMGVRRLTLVDPDCYDRSNAPRQLAMGDELGQPKPHALARFVAGQMTNPGKIVAVHGSFDEALALSDDPSTALVVGVDNNGARLSASRYARRRRIPSVFSMLSRDGLRAQIFLQTPDGACLSCVLPDLDAGAAAPCAAVSIASCYVAVAHAVMMVTSAIMSKERALSAWRETSLDGSTERVGQPEGATTAPVESPKLSVLPGSPWVTEGSE